MAGAVRSGASETRAIRAPRSDRCQLTTDGFDFGEFWHAESGGVEGPWSVGL